MSLDTAPCPRGDGGWGQQTYLVRPLPPGERKALGVGVLHLSPLLRFRGFPWGLLGPAQLYIPNLLTVVGHSVVRACWRAGWKVGWMEEVPGEETLMDGDLRPCI